MDRDDRNTTGLYGDGRAPPYAMDREDREKLLLEKMSIPQTYAKNSTKEELCLAFIETFKAQYVALYPSRAPLLLSPLNECGRLKFISTFIRPTALRYDELYDYSTCAAYVSNYIKYEPLDPPEILPSKVMSPTTTLLWQVGNSIEVSLLLCSFLLGAGYNAYCVLGYANREITNNEADKVPCPEKLPTEANLDESGEKVTERPNKYKDSLKQRPKLKSKYDDEYLGKKDTNDDDEDDNLNVQDTYAGKLDDGEEEEQKPVHAWVMLLPKKRKVTQPIFIEPSTGMAFKINDPRYLGIEAVFNHQNYYVNLRPGTPISDLALELRDLSHWEHVFLADPEMAAEDDPPEQERLRQEDMTADDGEAGDQTLDLPASWVSPLTLSRQQFENRYPGKRKVVTYADAKVEYFAEFSDSELRVMEVRLHDDKSSVHQSEQIHTFYKHRQDKLRRRSTFPSLERAHAAPRETRDWFDSGRKRERVEGLLEHIYVPGHHRTMFFDWAARDDGLAKRVEFFFSEKDQNPKKIEEFFRGREEDRLIYRSADYDPPKEATALGMQLGSAGGAGGSTQNEYRVPAKMTERFERNLKISADEDVAERTFIKPQSPDGEIWVIYQYSKNCITRPYRIFPRNAEKEKDTSASGGGTRGEVNPRVVTMPFTDPPKETDLQEELRVLLLRERECFVEIRNKATEITKDLLSHLREEQAAPQPVLSVYDTLRNRPKETEAELEQIRAEELRKAESRKDYLAPYIANLDIAKSSKGDYTSIRLTAEQAKKVRDEALRDLKERLIQRGHIMQNRMDREREELNRRQTAHAKSLDANDATKDIEEFSQFSKEVAWRMKILDERLSRHIEQASDKYAKLARRLAEDTRLKLIYPQ